MGSKKKIKRFALQEDRKKWEEKRDEHKTPRQTVGRTQRVGKLGKATANDDRKTGKKKI